MSKHITQLYHPVGSRVLVAFMIKNSNPDMQSCGFPRPAFRWEESEQLCELNILEYSPSKEHVRVSSVEEETYLSRVGGWYPVSHIVVKEILPNKPKKGKQ